MSPHFKIEGHDTMSLAQEGGDTEEWGTQYYVPI